MNILLKKRPDILVFSGEFLTVEFLKYFRKYHFKIQNFLWLWQSFSSFSKVAKWQSQREEGSGLPFIKCCELSAKMPNGICCQIRTGVLFLGFLLGFSEVTGWVFYYTWRAEVRATVELKPGEAEYDVILFSGLFINHLDYKMVIIGRIRASFGQILRLKLVKNGQKWLT